ncbi:glycoside hydrolase family 88/105 protein [Streptomyces sp. cg35]|uniref:glycoside hydrolase family 88/105 protein n=1 Tax=Streptomyces sp. cg35 TaxID=3421650 RepID=UPI003D1812EB
MITRRTAVASGLGLAASLLLPSTRASAAPARPSTSAALPEDLSRAVVDSTLARIPDPADFGAWGYPQGLFLLGAHRVHQRLGEPSYLDYIRRWVDRSVDANGHIDNSFDTLDSMQPGNLLLVLHEETGDPRYRIAADSIRQRFTTYPRTADGAMWHGTSKTNELWADGVFMAQPFLLRYGLAYGDEQYAYEQVTRNLTTYFAHQKADNGLLYHAFDADGDAPWHPDPATGTSGYFWGRAIGWTAMTHIEVLELLPADHPSRPRLIENVRHLARGFVRYQDPASGRWFQVVDRGEDDRNWTETSASAMYTLMLSEAVRQGYVQGAEYERAARRGLEGVLAKVTASGDGMVDVHDISVGTNVGDLEFYYERARSTNDLHGLGALLLMNERLRH